MNTRDQLIIHLLALDDQNKITIAELQKQNDDLQKQIAALTATIPAKA